MHVTVKNFMESSRVELLAMKIAVVGIGYVGLVVGACFAENGNDVICVDNDVSKIRGLKLGRVPIYEPGLEELVSRNQSKKRLTFTSSLARAVRTSQIIFIAVGTPSGRGRRCGFGTGARRSTFVSQG